MTWICFTTDEKFNIPFSPIVHKFDARQYTQALTKSKSFICNERLTRNENSLILLTGYIFAFLHFTYFVDFLL